MFRFRRRSGSDFSNEIQAHLDLEVDRLIAEGMSPDDARLAARRTFGSVLAAEERFHESRRVGWIDRGHKDLQASIRSLVRYPVATLVAVLSFAGAIGAAVTTLLVRDVIFHRPPELYRNPSELSRVQTTDPLHPSTGDPVPGPLFAAWNADYGATLAAATQGLSHEVRAGEQTVNLPVRGVTREFFNVLGVPAELGQTINGTSPERSVVLSYRVWRVLFDGRPNAIGEPLWIDGLPYTVAGVMPDRFWFASMQAQAWRLLEPKDLAREARLEVVARRISDVSPARLSSGLQRATDSYTAQLAASEPRLRVKVSGIEGTPMGNQVSASFPWLLGACVLLTVLISCANVAILVIAQWTSREHELSIRAAIGASRGQIIRLLLTESLLLAAAGGALGVCVTLALRGLIVWRGGEMIRQFDLSIPPRLFLEAAVVTLLAGLIAGIGPALLETRRLLGNPLQSLRTSERVRQRWRHALVVAEITVTVALLVVTAGMVEAYDRQMHGKVGYETTPLLMTHVENPDGVPIATVTSRLAAMPGVTAVAASTSVPFLGDGPLQRMATDAQSSGVQAERATIAPAFFSTLGVPMRRGRSFTSADSPAAHVVIVNETLAAGLWSDREPVGQRMWIEGEAYEVVGVVADYRNTALQNHAWDAKAFVPFAANDNSLKSIDFLIRATGTPAAVLSDVRKVVRAAASGNGSGGTFTLNEIIAVASEEILVGTAPLLPLIATAMFLTTAGIYGVLAFAITRRSQELAVRVAMGATGLDLVRLVSAHSLRLVGSGAALGLGATFALSRIVRAMGGAGTMLDPSPRGFVIPAVVILITAAIATLVPSRRAFRVSPVQLLRTN